MQNNLSKTFYKRLKKYILFPSKSDYTKNLKIGHKFSNNIVGKFTEDNLKIYLLNKHHKYVRTFNTSQQFFDQLSIYDLDGTVRSYFVLNNFSESTTMFELNSYEKIEKIINDLADITNYFNGLY